jgi:hypothetical protein
MQWFTPTQHDKSEWSRLAQAAYRAGRNSIGHTYSVAASIPRDAEIPLAHWDYLQYGYRTWLCFNEFPQMRGYVSSK